VRGVLVRTVSSFYLRHARGGLAAAARRGRRR
jgi:hypothetical protein